MENNTETIVKEFLELWQKQYAYMSRDGDSASQAIEAFRQMQEAYVNTIGSGLGNKGNAKSTATSDIFRNIGNEFIKLAKSYAELEERIAKLESCINGTMEKPARKNPEGKSTRAGKRTTKTNN